MLGRMALLIGLILVMGATGCVFPGRAGLGEDAIDGLRAQYEDLDGVASVTFRRTPDRFGAEGVYELGLETAGLNESQQAELVVEALRIFWEETDYTLDRFIQCSAFDVNDPSISANPADVGITEGDGLSALWVGMADLEDFFGPRD